MLDEARADDNSSARAFGRKSFDGKRLHHDTSLENRRLSTPRPGNSEKVAIFRGFSLPL
jgi:hypothetical protein